MQNETVGQHFANTCITKELLRLQYLTYTYTVAAAQAVKKSSEQTCSCVRLAGTSSGLLSDAAALRSLPHFG